MEYPNRLGLPLYTLGRTLFEVELVAELRGRAFREQHFSRLGQRTETRTRVHRVADHGVLERLAAADVPGDDFSGIDTNADFDGRFVVGLTVSIEFFQLGLNRERCAHRPMRPW